MDKYAVRVFFSKKGRAAYISHLDLLRTMQRALKRSGLPVWYSEGFNPRIYLNFPLPLPLGTEAEREPMDFYATEEIPMEEFALRLDGVCPEGIRVLSSAAPVYHNKHITSAEYVSVFSGDMEKLRDAYGSLLSAERIEVKKHSKKKGEITVDIKPHIKVVSADFSDSGLTLDYILPAGNELTLNAGLLTGAFLDICGDGRCVCTKRTNIFTENGCQFA